MKSTVVQTRNRFASILPAAKRNPVQRKKAKQSCRLLRDVTIRQKQKNNSHLLDETFFREIYAEIW